MKFHADPISYNLRLFRDGDYGDQYDWSCRADVIEGVAHLSLVQSMIPGVRKALMEWGKLMGLKEFRWTRYKQGRQKTIHYICDQ